MHFHSARSRPCITADTALTYAGARRATIGGMPCVDWAPVAHAAIAALPFVDGSIEAAENYCRNPDGDTNGPWCYYTHLAFWDYCLLWCPVSG